MMQEMLPQYHFSEILGRGGMGAVYKATQRSLDRLVAIKVLPAALMDDADINFVERFKNEARTMARMSHPGIVSVFDFGEAPGGLLYIVMEFVSGTDVAKMTAAQGHLPPEYALAITAHVCDALEYAHNHGVIHRDIKPANILISAEGMVKVADFGLAKANDATQICLTKTNVAMGSPDYVAPEAMMHGVQLDGRADLYAVGVMLYQMLSGHVPRGMWTMPSAKLGTDPRFDAIIAKAMQMDRESRYQRASEIRLDLDVIMTTPRVTVRDSRTQQQRGEEAGSRGNGGESNHGNRSTSGRSLIRMRGPANPAVAAERPKAAAKTPPPNQLYVGALAGCAACAVVALGVYLFFKPAPATGVASSPSQAAAAGRSAGELPWDGVRNSRDEPQPPPPPGADKGGDGHRPRNVGPPPFRRPKKRDSAEAGAVNLLAAAHPPRDSIEGEWTRQNRSLLGQSQSGFARLAFDTTVPEEYDFHLVFSQNGAAGAVAQHIALPDGREVIWLMGAFDGKVCAWERLDGKDSQGSPAAVRMDLDHARPHDCLIRVRKDRLQVEMDGAVVSELQTAGHQWSVPAPWKFADPQKLGIGCQQPTLFHIADMIPVPPAPPPEKPMTAQKTAIAAAPRTANSEPPAPSQSVPPTQTVSTSAEMDAVAQRLAEMEAQFTLAFERDAGGAFKVAITALNANYAGALDRALKTANQQGGNLDDALAIREEAQRISTGQAMPAEDPETLPQNLKTLRATYRQAYDKLAAERDKKAAPLYAFYDQALRRYEAELTQLNKTTDAQRVKSRRESMAK